MGDSTHCKLIRMMWCCISFQCWINKMLSTLRGNRSSSKSLTHRRAQGYPLSHNKMGTNFPTTRSSTHCEAWGLPSKTKKRNLVKSILTSTLCGSNSDNSAQAPCNTGASPGPKQTTKPKPKKGKSQTKTIVVGIISTVLATSLVNQPLHSEVAGSRD